MPRGLISIVLIYRIPDTFRLDINDNIIAFVIVATGLIMGLGPLLTARLEKEKTTEDINQA